MTRRWWAGLFAACVAAAIVGWPVGGMAVRLQCERIIDRPHRLRSLFARHICEVEVSPGKWLSLPDAQTYMEMCQ